MQNGETGVWSTARAPRQTFKIVNVLAADRQAAPSFVALLASIAGQSVGIFRRTDSQRSVICHGAVSVGA
jgi:hypothetical protein